MLNAQEVNMVLKARLSHLNRDTLVTVSSAMKKINYIPIRPH